MNVLYSTGCPRCKILKDRMDEIGMSYEVCADKEVMKQKGITSVPVLEIQGELLNFSKAIEKVKWFKNLTEKSKEKMKARKEEMK